MAITKKERAAIDAANADLIERLRIAELRAALHWTQPVQKDLPAPSPMTRDSISGWEFNAYTKSITQCWSESFLHGYGESRASQMSSASRGSRSLFSTRLLCLRALRNAVEMDAAAALQKIDADIANEIAAQTKDQT